MTSKGNKKVVVSTRPSAPGDSELAQSNHIELIDCPAFYYRWITPSAFVIDSVFTEPLPEAWVFTSRRGVEGWWRIWKERDTFVDRNTEDSEDHTSGKNPSGRGKNGIIPPVYVVGEKTRAAYEQIFPVSEIRMAEEHNAIALGLLIVADGVRSVAHFCSVERRSELRDICKKFEVNMTEVEVYQSCAVTDTEPVKGPVDAVFFFSPNGVSEFQRLYGLPEGDWQAVAVGPTTADEVRRVTDKVPLVASTPSFQEMINLILR